MMDLKKIAGTVAALLLFSGIASGTEQPNVLLPTVIEAVGLPEVKGLEGKSLWPILRGNAPDEWREFVCAAMTYYAKSEPEAYFPGRAMIGREYTYIFNIHSMRDPERVNAFDAGYPLIQMLKRSGKREQARAEHLVRRPPEEFYNTKKDPGCWNNLVKNPEQKPRIEKYKKALELEMRTTADPESSVFSNHTPAKGDKL